jgi:hypothetical protein
MLLADVVGERRRVEAATSREERKLPAIARGWAKQKGGEWSSESRDECYNESGESRHAPHWGKVAKKIQSGPDSRR